MNPKTLIVFTDGASSGNPGPGWAMWVIAGSHKLIASSTLQKRVKLEHCTNNDAEYKALIFAIEDLQKNPQYLSGYEKILFQLDSKLVVEQVNGRWKIKDPKIREYVTKVNLLLTQFSLPFTIKYIPREENLADKLKYD